MSYKTRSAEDVVKAVDKIINEHKPHLREAAQSFHEDEGTLIKRSDAIDKFQSEFDVSDWGANKLVSKLVGDTVDPIVQLPGSEEKWVGVIEFKEFDGAYGYVDYDDIHGERNRVVCQQCVNEAEYDTEVTHATAGDPNGTFSADATYDELLEGIHSHYEETHNVVPSEVNTGATLASGTTIGGNISWHAGNDGTGSGLDADLIQGGSPGRFQDGIYGDGSDGNQTNFANGLEHTQTFEVTSGNTVTGNNLVIFARDEIIVDGTIDVTGGGAAGAIGPDGEAAEESVSTVGNPGDDGRFYGSGTGGGAGGGDASSGNKDGENGVNGGGGGSGGGDFSTDGEPGGDAGGNTASFRETKAIGNITSNSFSSIVEDNVLIGAGGGSGAGGGNSANNETGQGGDGGDGGDGGGAIILVAPSITISGTLRAAGQDGQDGGDAFDNNDGGMGGGGGGGGGAGGTIVVVTENLTENSPTYDVSGGQGGIGGQGDTAGGVTGGDGGNGGTGVSGDTFIFD